MKILKNNIKLIIGLIVGAILAGGTVYAAVSANQITYIREGTNIKNVAEALNELYKNQNQPHYMVLETGSVNSNNISPLGYQKYTITLKNNYTENQNAMLFISSPVITSGTINPYIQSAQFSQKIIGNTIDFFILNYTDVGTGGSASFDYAVLGTK